MNRIFISYSHSDKKFVKRLTKDLGAAFINVWLDEKEIKVGESITRKVEEGITNCNFFCLVISIQSIKSNWVEREYKTALNMQLSSEGTPRILPLKIQNVELPVLLRDIRYADFSADYNIGFKQLIDAIKDNGRHKMELLPSEIEIVSSKFLFNLY
ncbi:MAG: toll/interleukin-1 receptor domain-containing protein [Candidatus Omnitrophota bacterium]